MATGETKNITGSLTLEYQYQTTIYDDILTISSATITLNDPAGEIFTDKGNDTVTVTDSTITNNSESGAQLMFSMGSDNDTLTISNSTLNADTFMGSGDDEVFVTGDSQSQVTIRKKFSLGSGNDILTIGAIFAGNGNIDFGEGNDTLVFNGGKLLVAGSISALTNLTVTGNGGTLGTNLSLTGTEMAVTMNGNLTGDNNSRVITISSGNAALNTANNIKTNIRFDLTDAVLIQSDNGTLEFDGISSYYAFTAKNATLTLHDIVVGACSGAFSLTDTLLTVRDSNFSNNTDTAAITAAGGRIDLTGVGISNNKTGINFSGSTLTGADVSFTANSNHALNMYNGNADLTSAYFSGNYASASACATAYAYAHANAWGGAIAQDSGDLTLTSASFSGNYATAIGTATAKAYVVNASASSYAYVNAYGGAIANTSGTVTLSDATFSGNYAYAYTSAYTSATAKASRPSAFAYATAYGGAITNTSGTVTLSDATFAGNYAYAYASASAKAYASSPYAYADAKAYGGAITNTSGTVTLSDATFSGNYAYAYASAYANAKAYASAKAYDDAYGGAIANTSGTVTLSGATFAGNYAYAYASASAYDYGFYAIGTATANAYGGAIANTSGTVTLSDATFSGNYAYAYASAYASDDFRPPASAYATAYGGAIYAENSILNLTDTTFSGNYAYADASAKATATAIGTATANTYGGAIYLSNSTMTYAVSQDNDVINCGNDAKNGGFINFENSDAIFDIAGTLTVGDSANKDSFSGSGSITKNGNGVMTINSDISGFSGIWNLAGGILKLERIARTINLDKWTIGVDTELHLSALNDTINMGIGKKIGIINLGGGNDTINTGGYHLSGGQLLISKLTLSGGGKVSSKISNRTAGTAFDITLNGVILASDITGGNAADKITITQTSELSGIIALGNGANTISASYGTKTTFSNAFSAGSGNDSLKFHQVKFEESLELGDGTNVLTATGEAQFSNVLTGSGNDIFSLRSASFSGSVDLGDGTNSITATAANFYKGINGGSGNDSIKMTEDSSISGVVELGGGKNYVYTSKNLNFNGSFKLNANGETHLIVYNGASLTENSLTVYADENAEMESAYLDWSDIEGLDKVRILVSSYSTFETFEFTVELYNQTKDFTLNLEKGYFFQFQAQDEDGWSQRLLSDTEAPDQVTGFFMNGTTAVWDVTNDNLGGNGVKQYNIQVASDADFNSVIGTYTSTTNSYSFASYAEGNYFIRIQAEDFTGNKGEWSNVENLMIDNKAPSKVTVSGKATNNSITVNWNTASDSVSGVKEYNVEISKSSTFSTIEKAVTVTGTTFSATDFVDGTYYFRVQAVDNVGNKSEWSTVSSVVIVDTISATLDGSGMTHADAIAAGYELIVTTGGTYKSNFGHDGVQARIEGGTFSCTVGGGALTSSTNYKTWDEQTGNTNLSITGGTFNKVLMGGDRVNYGNCEHVGDLNLTINGGTFNSQIVGGMAYTDQSIRGQALLTGDIYMTLAGGTFKSRIYGGCISTANYSTRTAIEGNVNIVVDSSENELIFADSVYIVAGSYQSGAIYGNVQVTFTGLGENLKMDADNLVWGGCSSDVYLINGDTRTFQSTISGTRTICFDDFTGEFNTGIRGFNVFKAANGSKLEILASNHLRDIERWELDWDTQLSGSFLNDFKGDTMNIDLTGWNQTATNLFDCAAGTFTEFDAMKKVTIGNETAVYSDAISGYVSTNYMLTLRDNQTMQLSMNTTIA